METKNYIIPTMKRLTTSKGLKKGDWIAWESKTNNYIFEVKIIKSVHKKGFIEHKGCSLGDKGLVLDTFGETEQLWTTANFPEEEYIIYKLNEKEIKEMKLKIALFEL